MTALVDSGTGRAVAGQKDALILPPRWKANANVPIVLLSHGSGLDAYSWVTWPNYSKAQLISERYGLPCVTGDLDAADATTGHAVGNDTSQNNALTLIAWAQARAGTKTGAGSVLICAGSMGTHLALNLWKNNPALIRAAALGLPTTSVTAAYNASKAGSDAGAYAGYIDTAYAAAGGWPAAAPTHDPYLYAAQLTGLPIWLGDTTDDPLNGGQAGVTALATAIGGTAVETHFYGTGGHDLTRIPADAMAAFLARHSGLT